MDNIVPLFHSLLKSLRKIHKKGCDDVTIVQHSIMYEISQMDRPSMQTIAEVLGVDITTFSRQIGTLIKKKLVVRTASKDDRRIYILSLTEEGKEIVASVNERIATDMDNLLLSMNDFERDTIIRSMQVLTEKLNSDKL